MTLETIRVTGKRDYKDDPPQFLIRTGSSDIKAINDVFDSNAYRRPRLGFTIEPGERWLDGGCNIGAFSVLVNGVVGAECIAVEPSGSNFDLAQRNLELNDCKVELVKGALVPSAEPGETITLYESPKPSHFWRQSTVINRKGSIEVEVPALGIDQLIADGWDCLKLDIEGSEIPILEQADFSRAKKVTAEWSFDVDPMVDRLFDVVERMKGFGFNEMSVSVKEEKYPRGTKWEWFPPNAYMFFWRS